MSSPGKCHHENINTWHGQFFPLEDNLATNQRGAMVQGKAVRTCHCDNGGKGGNSSEVE